MPKVGFGSQIRNYFLHPDQRVKDARTGHLVGNFHSVLDGNIQVSGCLPAAAGGEELVREHRWKLACPAQTAVAACRTGRSRQESKTLGA